MGESTNFDFNVNIIDDSAFTEPNVPLAFTLPCDKETYIDIEGNEKLSKSVGVLMSFFDLVMGTKLSEAYSTNEYRFSMNKSSPTFMAKMKKYMDDQLGHADPVLDELVSDIVEKEVSLKLTKSSDFHKRAKEVKNFMINYYRRENSKNLPNFCSANFLRMCYYTVISVLRKVFPGGVWCNNEQISAMYKKYLDNPMSIVYLANHQSHVDYMLLHLVCIRFQLAIPSVIAGENLNVAIFGSILKSLGAIFIKRSFNNEAYTERNLNNAMEFLLMNKIPLEVFIEGTRSRDGKLLLPKYGILKSLTKIFQKQRRSNDDFDMLLQPISITYERIYEADGYLKELVGYNKKEESLFNILKGGFTNALAKTQNKDKNHVPEIMKQKDEYFVNSMKNLPGKIFIKLGNSFYLSDFMNNEKKELLDSNPKPDRLKVEEVNLKKLGFNIMHEINKVSYLTPIGLIGGAIMSYYYHSNLDEFSVSEVVKVVRILNEDLFREEKIDVIRTNLKLLERISKFSDIELGDLVMDEVSRLLRFVTVNFKRRMIKVATPIELLYYKNKTIHLVFHRYLLSFILSSLAQENKKTISINTVKVLFHILSRFCKYEFLLEYDFNPRHEIDSLISTYMEEGKLKIQASEIIVLNEYYFGITGEQIKPFIQTFVTCTEALLHLSTQNFDQSNSKQLEIGAITAHATTRQIIKEIQVCGREKFKNATGPERYVEQIYTQYLMSTMVYLDNRQVISLLKEKTGRTTHVKVLRQKELSMSNALFKSIINGEYSSLPPHITTSLTNIVDDTRSISMPKL